MQQISWIRPERVVIITPMLTNVKNNGPKSRKNNKTSQLLSSIERKQSNISEVLLMLLMQINTSNPWQEIRPSEPQPWGTTKGARADRHEMFKGICQGAERSVKFEANILTNGGNFFTKLNLICALDATGAI